MKSYSAIKKNTGRFVYWSVRPKSVYKRHSTGGCCILLINMNAVYFTFNTTARGSNDDMDYQYHKTANVHFSAGAQKIFEFVASFSDKILSSWRQTVILHLHVKKKKVLSKLFVILPEYLGLSIFLVSVIQQFWTCKYLHIYTNKNFKAMISSVLCILLIILLRRLKGINFMLSRIIWKVLTLYSQIKYLGHATLFWEGNGISCWQANLAIFILQNFWSSACRLKLFWLILWTSCRKYKVTAQEVA